MRKVVLVTGGARRVGATVVRAFAREGYAIVLHYGSSRHDAETLAAELNASGTPVHCVQSDLRDKDAPQTVVNAAMSAYGRLDVLVNNASIMQRCKIDDITESFWDDTHTVNLRAPFFLSRAAAKVMLPGSSIIHMADHLADETGYPTLFTHQISKGAIPGMVRILAQAFAPSVRVNGVKPGLVLAPEDFNESLRESFLADVPLERWGTPEDVAAAILFLVNAPYITGEVVAVDGGRSLRR